MTTSDSAPGAVTAAHRQALGRTGEDLVALQVQHWGWTVLERNWRNRHGELDIVALDGDEVVVIEVKTRSSLAFGHPAQAVSRAKLARLRRLAGYWLQAHPDVDARFVRIDVAALVRRDDGFELDYLRAVSL